MLPVASAGIECDKGNSQAIHCPHFSHFKVSFSLQPRHATRKVFPLMQSEYNATVESRLVVTKPTKEHDAVFPIAPGISRYCGRKKLIRIAFTENNKSATLIPTTSRIPLVARGNLVLAIFKTIPDPIIESVPEKIEQIIIPRC